MIKSGIDGINQNVFWAAAKLYALKEESAPVTMIDTDLFVWGDIRDTLNKSEIAVLHREDLEQTDCYLPSYELGVRDGYCYDPEWDWSENPCNTALAYFRDDGFKNYYVSKAIDFMYRNEGPALGRSCQMVFAEQRLLAMCAKQKGVHVFSFLDDPYQINNSLFTHLWGAKRIATE